MIIGILMALETCLILGQVSQFTLLEEKAPDGRSGWVREAGRGKTAHGWKGDRPWVRLKERTGEPTRSPKITSAKKWSWLIQWTN